jgi:hypothetical protein
VLLARASGPSFDDASFDWGAPVSYFVRAYTEIHTGIAESGDSPVAAITPADRFPPSPPAGLRAVVSEISVELSWNLSPEPDTAGYNVYRQSVSGPAAGRSSSGERTKRLKLNQQPLTAPVYSDRDIQRQEQYSYAVTAVDDKGNESDPGAAVEVRIP